VFYIFCAVVKRRGAELQETRVVGDSAPIQALRLSISVSSNLVLPSTNNKRSVRPLSLTEGCSHPDRTGRATAAHPLWITVHVLMERGFYLSCVKRWRDGRWALRGPGGHRRSPHAARGIAGR